MKQKGFDYLKKISAVDYGTQIEVFYLLYSMHERKEEIITVKLPLDSLRINSVAHIYKAADWYEREMFEMFGIKIAGKRTKKLLLEKWNGSEYPLRKSFAWGDQNYKKVEE